MDDTIDALTERANQNLKDAEEYETEADKAVLAAGKALAELKTRITNKESDEGKEWAHSWPQFVKAKIGRTPQHCNRLIKLATSADPQEALVEYRIEKAERMRLSRALKANAQRNHVGSPEAKAGKSEPAAKEEHEPWRKAEDGEQHSQDEQAASGKRQRPIQTGRARKRTEEQPDIRPETLEELEAEAGAAILVEADTLEAMWNEVRVEAQEIFMHRVGLVRAVPQAA